MVPRICFTNIAGRDIRSLLGVCVHTPVVIYSRDGTLTETQSGFLYNNKRPSKQDGLYAEYAANCSRSIDPEQRASRRGGFLTLTGAALRQCERLPWQLRPLGTSSTANLRRASNFVDILSIPCRAVVAERHRDNGSVSGHQRNEIEQFRARFPHTIGGCWSHLVTSTNVRWPERCTKPAGRQDGRKLP